MPGPDHTIPLPGPPIRVDGRTIAADAISREVQYHPAGSLTEAYLCAARALVVRELLLAEADRLGIEGDERRSDETLEEARIRALLERCVEVPDPTEEDCRRYYESNRGRMRIADEHEVSHILVLAPPDDAEARAQARARAVALTAEARAEPARWGELAREHSRCPSREAGGYLGWIGCGQTVPEFEQALRRQPVGAVASFPLESRFGFHVVQVHARRPGVMLAFETCRDRIGAYLRDSVRRRAISQYIRILAGRHDIEGIDLGAVDNPLVQ